MFLFRPDIWTFLNNPFTTCDNAKLHPYCIASECRRGGGGGVMRYGVANQHPISWGSVKAEAKAMVLRWTRSLPIMWSTFTNRFFIHWSNLERLHIADRIRTDYLLIIISCRSSWFVQLASSSIADFQGGQRTVFVSSCKSDSWTFLKIYSQ